MAVSPRRVAILPYGEVLAYRRPLNRLATALQPAWALGAPPLTTVLVETHFGG